ncbi:hypothetical protein BVG16_15185 [Paenibacillus selenitireducens]|uniref:Uncharacterized protein n=2 Tax=Paenibacillus selenitireducens TaxID=1324314 RepID=A0A1T2XD15_9BACL|nr:hypothetical protein BVG16_15185 [Paenibacillus selenitireducens]
MYAKQVKSLFMICLFLFLTIALTGCWDKKNIQDINYVAALGIDYVDNKYIVYSQSLDFTNVARQDTTKSKEHVPVWLGRGEGVTLDAAVNDIYTASQLPIIWEHIGAIVFHERSMKQDLRKMIDTMLRYHEIRFTPWVFGTRSNMKELFAAPNAFNLSPLNSILHQPQDVYTQQSYIHPISLREMFIHLLRPGSTLLLPSISINHHQWFEDTKPTDQYEMDGIFAIEKNHFHGWWGKKDITGLRWNFQNVIHTALQIEPHQKPVAMLSLNVPASKIIVKIQGQRPKITLRLNIDGSIDETLTDMLPHQMEKLAEQKIRKEVQTTFRDGVQKNVDLFSIRKEIYRQHVNYWKSHQQGQGIPLSLDMLDQVDIKVSLKHAGMMKLRK